MVDADQPGPFTGLGQMDTGGEIAEVLQRIDLFLETMPEARAQGLDRLHGALLLLPELRGMGVIFLTGRS